VPNYVARRARGRIHATWLRLDQGVQRRQLSDRARSLFASALLEGSSAASRSIRMALGAFS